MTKNLTCIVCPLGCNLRIESENGRISNITGNTCPKGKQYAIEEFTSPKRVITTTVLCEDGLVSVKTNAAVPKDMIFECMKEINKIVIDHPVNQGDIVLKDILHTGADVVVTGR